MNFFKQLQELQEEGDLNEITTKTLDIECKDNREKRAEIHQWFGKNLKMMNTQTIPENIIRVNLKNPNKK